ncbi:MAG: alanine racemase, partial [Pseudomonadota bacterium]
MSARVTHALASLETPCLLVDQKKLRANLTRLADHIGSLGGILRPHVKTHKSVEIAVEAERVGNTRGITVSTLREAEYFFSHGFTDILYAVGVTPNKLAHAAQLMQRG